LRLPAAQAAERLADGNAIEVEVDGEILAIEADEVEVRTESRRGLAAAGDGPYVVAVSTVLTPELEAEGLAREFVRRIQELRKQSGFDIADRIEVRYRSSPRLARALEAHGEAVAAEILAVVLEAAAQPEGEVSAELAFEGEAASVSLSRTGERS
jgi:isoleucyl-tRNA synthetase